MADNAVMTELYNYFEISVETKRHHYVWIVYYVFFVAMLDSLEKSLEATVEK